MPEIVPYVERFGYLFLVGLGFLEFAGIPVVITPVLVACGALVVAGVLNPAAVVGAVVVGSLLAEIAWFTLARTHGRRLMGVACGLATQPMACILGVRRRLGRVGAPFILVAKFVPGAANLIAPASGMARMGTGRFLALDGTALLLWASFYTTLGILFAEPVLTALVWLEAWAETYLRPVLLGALALLAVAVGWRWLKARLHRRAHARLAESATEQ